MGTLLGLMARLRWPMLYQRRLHSHNRQQLLYIFDLEPQYKTQMPPFGSNNAIIGENIPCSKSCQLQREYPHPQSQNSNQSIQDQPILTQMLFYIFWANALFISLSLSDFSDQLINPNQPVIVHFFCSIVRFFGELKFTRLLVLIPALLSFQSLVWSSDPSPTNHLSRGAPDCICIHITISICCYITICIFILCCLNWQKWQTNRWNIYFISI